MDGCLFLFEGSGASKADREDGGGSAPVEAAFPVAGRPSGCARGLRLLHDAGVGGIAGPLSVDVAGQMHPNRGSRLALILAIRTEEKRTRWH